MTKTAGVNGLFWLSQCSGIQDYQHRWGHKLRSTLEFKGHNRAQRVPQRRVSINKPLAHYPLNKTTNTRPTGFTCNLLFLQKLFLWMFPVWGLWNLFSLHKESESRPGDRPPGRLRCVSGVGLLSVLQWGDPEVRVCDSVDVTVLGCWVVCDGTCVCVCVMWGVEVWTIKQLNICSNQSKVKWMPLHHSEYKLLLIH